MRICMIAMAIVGLTGICHARQQATAARPGIKPAMFAIPLRADMPPRDARSPARQSGPRDYRIDPSTYVDRSAHARAIDEMNAIHLRRPRVFRFRPVMALTMNAADIDEPPVMSGIAPSLMGVKDRR